jgi:ABC-type transport system involved in multi-copper enzyme maturation permease subunit
MTGELQILAYHLEQCASYRRLSDERARIENAARWSGGTAYLLDDSFGMRKSMDIIRRYAVKPAIIPALAAAENSGPPFSAMPKWGWQNYMDYIWGDVFAVLMAALLSTRLFPMEQKARSILLSTPKGRRQTTAAKFSAAVLLGFGVSVLFSCVTLLLVWFKDGLYGAGGSLLTVNSLAFTPLVCTLAQAAALFALHRVAGVVLVSLLCAVLAYFLRGSLVSYIGGLAFVGVSVGYYLLAGSNPFLPTGLRVLPDITALARPQWFFETYRAANIFGYPVFWSAVCLAFWTLLCGGLAAFAVWHSGRRARV